MRISRSRTSSAIGFPVPDFLKVSSKLLHLILMCCIRSAHSSPDSANSNALFPEILKQHAELCLKYDRGNDFLYTMESRNDGCYLECIILSSSSDTFSIENNFLTESRTLPHYLTGQCRDNNHMCDRGLCTDRSMLNRGPDFGNLTINIVRVLLSSSRNDADDDDSLPDPFVRIFVGDENFRTKTIFDNREPQFDESFFFGNVSTETQINFVVYDDDSQFFHNVIDSYFTTPADVIHNGWNNTLHFYMFNNTEGILAHITFA